MLNTLIDKRYAVAYDDDFVTKVLFRKAIANSSKVFFCKIFSARYE